MLAVVVYGKLMLCSAMWIACLAVSGDVAASQPSHERNI